jgi:hypothetical protein
LIRKIEPDSKNAEADGDPPQTDHDEPAGKAPAWRMEFPERAAWFLRPQSVDLDKIECKPSQHKDEAESTRDSENRDSCLDVHGTVTLLQAQRFAEPERLEP